MTYHAIYERAKDGRIWAHLIDVDGIVGNGATVDEARASLLESLRLMCEDGKGLPEPQDIVKFEEITAAA